MSSLNPSEEKIIVPDTVPTLTETDEGGLFYEAQRRIRFLTGLKDLRTGFKAKTLLHSLGYAVEGLAYAFKTQRNFRIHIGVASLVVIAGIIFSVSPTQWAVLFGMIALVLFAELANTVSELLVDMFVQDRYDLRAKAIKDMAAGAVLVTALGATACGMSIFIPRLLTILQPYWH